jgi:putative transposase
VKQADLDAGVRSDGLTTEEREELRRLRRENKQLRIEREIPKKSRSLVCSGDRLCTSEVFEFARANQAEFGVRALCRVLGVSPSGYYAWRDRSPSSRDVENERFLRRMREIHVFSRETYGKPRMYAELRDDGWLVNHKRVARLMKLDGLQGATRRKKWRTTKRAKDARPAPDLVERNFSVDGPDQLWVADITYVPTWSGFLYLAVVVDAWSRRVVGWSMETHLRTELVLQALNMALWQRKPDAVIHHSDQGTQPRFKGSSQRMRFDGSLGSPGSWMVRG